MAKNYTLVSNFSNNDWHRDVGFFTKKTSVCTFINEILEDTAINEYYCYYHEIAWSNIREFKLRTSDAQDVIRYETYLNDSLALSHSGYCEVCSPEGIDPIIAITSYKLQSS